MKRLLPIALCVSLLASPVLAGEVSVPGAPAPPPPPCENCTNSATSDSGVTDLILEWVLLTLIKR